MMHNFHRLRWLLFGCLLGGPVPGAVTPPAGFTALYNGRDLSGWRGGGTFDHRKWLEMPEAERAATDAEWTADMLRHWRAEGDELVNDGKGKYATTVKDYGDFELLVDYKTVPMADSGIYLRGCPQVQIWDYTDPEKAARGADRGSGGLWNNNSPGAAGKYPLVKADKPFGEWNHFRILMVGSRVSVWLNEQLVVDHAILDNHYDRGLPLEQRRPVPARGPIQLQTHGGEIRWCNIFIREIGAEEANRILASRGEDAAFKPVFNGRDFTGWKGALANYQVVDGAIVCRPDKGGVIFTEEEFGDFVVRLECKLPPGGNNGLALRYPGAGNPAYDGMTELQVLGDDHEQVKGRKLDPRQTHGSAYGMIPAFRGYQRPVGEWNFQEVMVKGSTIKVELNGTVILDGDLAKVTSFMDNREHPGKDRTSGAFGFAGHNDPVAFRDIRIKRLQAVFAAIPAPAVGGALMPRLSQDGEWIAVSYQGAIAKVRRAGGPLVILSQGEGWDVDPAWSPDGRYLAYVNEPLLSGPRSLRVIDAGTGAVVPLLKTVEAKGPLWFHPGGRRLLGRFGATAPSQLSWLDLETGEVAPLTFPGVDDRIEEQQRTPYTLSADGRWIYFALHPDRPGEQTGNNGPRAELFKAPASGGAPQQILKFRARLYGLSPGEATNGLYAVTDAGTSHNDIWHIPLDDPERGARKLTFGQADEDSPTTDAAGRWLVYTENSGGITRLVQQDPATGDVKTAPLDRVDFGEATGNVRLELIDENGDGTVARISIRRKDGKFHAPPGAIYRISAGLAHFYARDHARLELPAGQYELRAFRGPEYRMFEREFEVRPGSSEAVAVELRRWTDAAARGWYSGENHIHANYGYGSWYVTPETMTEQSTGEDLRVSNVCVANSDGDGVFDREFFTGGPHPLSTAKYIIYWNEEFRSTSWGHMTLFNLSQLVEPIFTGFLDTTHPWDIPTNADIAAATSAQGGMASYTHPTRNADPFLHAYSAKGLPVDVALGLIDAIDVMGVGYAPTVPIWYRLLNCGFRIPAAAGTDCFLNRVRSALPGWGRVYVHLPEGLNYEQWVDGATAGRSFVSNGPMIELSVEDRGIGDTLHLKAPGAVRIRGRAEAQFPLDNLDLVYNGRVVTSGRLAADGLTATLDEEVVLDRSGWLALRTSGPAVEYWAGGALGAHTNPIYVEVESRELDAREEAEYFLAWIDRLEALLRQRDRMHTGRLHIEMQLNAARGAYREIIQRSASKP